MANPQKEWRCRGSFDEAVAWVEAELRGLGLGMVLTIEQVRNTDHSAVVRVETTEGLFFFKAVSDSPGLANEARVLGDVSSILPEITPELVSRDIERRWMITAAFDPFPDEIQDYELLETAIKAFAQSQIRSCAHLAVLLSSEILDQRLQGLGELIESLVAESAVRDLFEAEEYGAITEAVSSVPSMCAELADCSIQQGLVHGDLGHYNLGLCGGRPLAYDWTSAGLSFPFFDAVEFLRHREIAEGVDGLRVAYLQPFRDLHESSVVDHAWKLSQPLGYLFMALNYRALWGDHRPLAEPIPHFLRRAMDAMP